jgi:ABC-2 type transport system permease protein
VGIGVLYPNFKEMNPSKIVSGFGGTLCLVLSFLYIFTCVLILGFGTNTVYSNERVEWVSMGLFSALSFVLGWLPLKLAYRHLKTLEV